MPNPPTAKPPNQPNLLAVVTPYRVLVGVLLLVTVASGALTLLIPRIVAGGIDAATAGTFAFMPFLARFLAAAGGILVLGFAQNFLQTHASERVAQDLRKRLVAKISEQDFTYVETKTAGKLLTNATSDVDAVKMFVSMAVVSLVSSVLIVVGASIMLLTINWKLALVVLLMIPLIAGTFFGIFSKVGALFRQSQQVIDRLNKVINESILGAGLIRVLNAQQPEFEKFVVVNGDARATGLKILRLFASMIPVVTFVANLAVLTILVLGGKFVIGGSMTIGQLAAFNSYVAALIFPIIMIGFMSNLIGRASASYARIAEILDAPAAPQGKNLPVDLKGLIEGRGLALTYGEKQPLKNVSFAIKPGTRTAIIGPTAAGKTLLLQLLAGLTVPTAGEVLYDGVPVQDYDPKAFHAQVGFVFQDSVVFSLSLRENIAFHDGVTPESLKLAIETAELGDFVDGLPDKLETVVSERGLSLSGGQKQRLMLARALALAPRILFLDDFTARVDAETERRILTNVRQNYPGLTLVSVTQKIAPIHEYDQVILLMEGEILANGTHDELMRSSPDYVQIARSQQTTNEYGNE